MSKVAIVLISLAAAAVIVALAMVYFAIEVAWLERKRGPKSGLKNE